MQVRDAIGLPGLGIKLQRHSTGVWWFTQTLTEVRIENREGPRDVNVRERIGATRKRKRNRSKFTI